VDDVPNVEFGTDRTETHTEIPLTDQTPGKWLYDEKQKRLYLNTGDGNPSVNHLIEVSVNSFSLDAQARPGTEYDGRGVLNVGIRLRGLTFDRLRSGLEGGTTLSVIEDCVIRLPGGTAGLNIWGTNNIVRRNTVLNSLHQAIWWRGSCFVFEDNLVVGALQDPQIVGTAWEGVFKTNGGDYSTIRNNVIAEVPPAEHHGGGLGIWCDIASSYNAIYGNVSYRQATGIYVEQSQNANVLAYNTCFENGSGIGVRNNIFNLILGNYLFRNRSSAIWFGTPERYPPMVAQRVEGNWLVDNGAGILVEDPAPLGWNIASLDRNVYSVPKGGRLVQWGGKGYTELETLRKDTGQEIHGRVGEFTEDEIQLVKFRVPHSSTPDLLVPMVANPTLVRASPSGVSGYANRPYFWRQGDGDGLSLGVGVESPWSMTGGIIKTSYPAMPPLWAAGGSYVAGIIAVRLAAPDGSLVKEHEGVEEKRWGISIEGVVPEKMHPLGEGWWSPSLPTVPGTRYKVHWRSLAEGLEPIAGKPASGPVVFVRWTNDTGQNIVRHYLWGIDDQGKTHEKLPSQGSYPWSAADGEVVAPEGATRVAFFFGLRECKGVIKFRDIYIEGS
ncbi:MAG: right-handed parallel beta-helix repeat-containing protein, partial [Planctomycetes bacterium]|nr:right-handed parallel beta-helix repeat-containing protein [Planctomycetota bacterium]